MNDKIRKKIILNAPYLFLGLYATKLMQAYRLANGVDFSTKLVHLDKGFSRAFESPFPSFASKDLMFGIVVGILLRLLVWIRGKNRKKYRRNVEYGSARWSA